MDGIEGGEVQGTEPTGESAPGLNPAWNDVLSVIPETLHQQVTPHFQQWDQAAQQRIENVNQQLSQFESYKPFVENGISAEDIEQGLQFIYQLNTNPQGVYQALAEAYGYQQQQAPNGNEGESESEPELPNDPRFDQLQQGLDLVAQTILQQQQQKMEQEAEAQIESELSSLKQKHPNITEEFVLPLMLNGFDVDAIGQRWEAMTQSILQQNPRPFAPQVMGSSTGGTGLPSQAIDPTKLDGKATRNLVVQMLNQANRES